MPELNKDIAAAQAWWKSLSHSVPSGVAGLKFGLFTAVDPAGHGVRIIGLLAGS